MFLVMTERNDSGKIKNTYCRRKSRWSSGNDFPMCSQLLKSWFESLETFFHDDFKEKIPVE